MTIAVSVDIPTTIDSRIKTIVYNPNEVIELTFHYGFQSFIEFEEDEDIEIISLGESFPWKVTPVGKRMFIRPMQINTNTNMTVITTKRTYMFQLRADSYENKGDEELIYSVRFFYPDGSNKIPAMTGSKYSNVKNLGDKSQDEINSVLDNFKRGTVLNFDYSMTTNRNKSIKILRVFDDGISTYFEFENKNIIPNIYSVDLNGKETQIKYFIDGPYVVVNMVQLQFSLRVTDNIVCIFNNSMLY
jgi:type IV secretion system protein VirB9